MPKNFNRLFLQKTTALEQKYEPLLFAAIKDFRTLFINDYKEQGKDYALQRLQLTHVHSDIALILQNIYDEAGPFGARLTTDEIKADANKKAAGGFGINQRWINAVRAYLKTHLVRLVQAISDTMRRDIVRILDKAIQEQLSINDTVKALQEEGLMKARARVIARTEIVRAANVGHAVGASDSPYEVLKTWSAAKDHRTRHSHRDINGHTVDELAKFPVPIYEGDKEIGTDQMLYPGDATAHVSNTINCFLPDELTSVNPKIIKHAFRNWYSGKTVTIKTASGNKFTCTPNHPILTTNGWVKAGELTKSHNLVKSDFINSYALSEFNVDDVPATFEQIFNALSVEGGRMRVSRRVVNFYGDLPASDVDVVRTVSFLPNRIKTVRDKMLHNNILANAYPFACFLFMNCAFFMEHFKIFWRSFCNFFMRLFYQLLSFFGRGLSHPQVHGFASASGTNVVLSENPVNNITANTVLFSELFYANAALKIGNNFGGRQFFLKPFIVNANLSQSDINESGTASKFSSYFFSVFASIKERLNFFGAYVFCGFSSYQNVTINQRTPDGFSCTADNVSDLLTSKARVVQFDNVVDVVSGFHDGYVYTFETVNQMYDINGYVARNCRCRVVYKAKRDADGNIIMRRNQTTATVVPMQTVPVYTPSQVAAILKAHIVMRVE